ncbi:MAG: dTDP-4-dehydrorhamnose 3,5-epimerase [Bacteroidota bacterium]|jgi:dTDP-4-dehydrorhamnose 3,5-epimerase
MMTEYFDIDGPVLIKPRVFSDSRGHFLETFNQERYREILGDVEFVQDNLSLSELNVVRGLHFQIPPFAQGKLVSVVRGAVVDVIVDLRKDSASYGRHLAVELNEEEHHQIWIPSGFAHGFLSIRKNTLFSYKCTAPYSPASERTLLWNDPDLAINWKVDVPIVSEKDALGELFRNFESPF